jgi:hypothetical protein
MKTPFAAGSIALIGLLFLSSTAFAWDQDVFEQYFQRSDRLTLGAGNAKDVNAITHIIDPWPRYVGNRQIPGNGERMSGAVERYRDVSKLNRGQGPQPIFPLFGTNIGISSGTGAGQGGAAGGGLGR